MIKHGQVVWVKHTVNIERDYLCLTDTTDDASEYDINDITKFNTLPQAIAAGVILLDSPAFVKCANASIKKNLVAEIKRLQKELEEL